MRVKSSQRLGRSTHSSYATDGRTAGTPQNDRIPAPQASSLSGDGMACAHCSLSSTGVPAPKDAPRSTSTSVLHRPWPVCDTSQKGMAAQPRCDPRRNLSGTTTRFRATRTRTLPSRAIDFSGVPVFPPLSSLSLDSRNERPSPHAFPTAQDAEPSDGTGPTTWRRWWHALFCFLRAQAS